MYIGLSGRCGGVLMGGRLPGIPFLSEWDVERRFGPEYYGPDIVQRIQCPWRDEMI